MTIKRGFLISGYWLRNSKASWSVKQKQFHFVCARCSIEKAKKLPKDNGSPSIIIVNWNWIPRKQTSNCCELISSCSSYGVRDAPRLTYTYGDWNRIATELMTYLQNRQFQSTRLIIERFANFWWIKEIQTEVLNFSWREHCSNSFFCISFDKTYIYVYIWKEREELN